MNEDLKQTPIGHAATARYNGANIDHVNDHGYTMLQKAAMNGHTDEVKFLIDNGANVNKVTEFGYTPIYLAAMNGHTDEVKLLIDNGANINQANEYYTTPIKIADKNGHTDVVKLLSEKINQDIINIKELFNHISDKEKISEKEADSLAEFYLSGVNYVNESEKNIQIKELSKEILQVSEESHKADSTPTTKSETVKRATIEFYNLLEKHIHTYTPDVTKAIAKKVRDSNIVRVSTLDRHEPSLTARNLETGDKNRSR